MVVETGLQGWTSLGKSCDERMRRVRESKRLSQEAASRGNADLCLEPQLHRQVAKESSRAIWSATRCWRCVKTLLVCLYDLADMTTTRKVGRADSVTEYEIGKGSPRVHSVKKRETEWRLRKIGDGLEVVEDFGSWLSRGR